MSELGNSVDLACPFEEALERVQRALAAEGFGVVSRLDLDKAFAEKLGTPFRRYTILGACNPTLAHKAVSARPEVGLLLPCNIVVEESEGGALVRLVDAKAMLGVGNLGETPAISELAADAQSRLSRVAATLAEEA